MTRDRGSTTITCEVCSTQVQRFNAWLRKPGGGKFCSRECKAVAQRAQIGPASKAWRGGTRKTNGYIYRYAPSHPNATIHNTVMEHRLIAERALGKVLRLSAPVHHVNHARHDNRRENLVVCHDEKYHRLLHARSRIVEAGGDPSREKLCGACGEVKARVWFLVNRAAHDGLTAQCRPCNIAASRQYRNNKEVCDG